MSAHGQCSRSHEGVQAPPKRILSHGEAKLALEKRFSSWEGKGGMEAPPESTMSHKSGVFMVDKRGAAQSQLRIGHLGIERSNPDYVPMVLCNAILGGMFNSRINMNLREDKGYTYGAFSALDFTNI